ncbi:MAG: hypothetical protein DMD60_07930 [Gemmatimonadetes bacterium]|nr:MAG: hypothetical protein DMD60_07930 [Gemmatimonadota bacterium]
MDVKFRKHLAVAHRNLRALLASTPLKTDALPIEMPASGVYLFTERGRHLYVGRSNRLRKGIPLHYRRASKHSSAAFAFRLARKATRREVASYKTEGSRKQLAADPTFARAFLRAKERIRRMEVRFVEEKDQLRQTLLEVCAAAVLSTPFNDFDTH